MTGTTNRLDIRKTWVVIEETRLVVGRADSGGPLRKVAACAVVRNPFAGQGYVENLTPLVQASRGLGIELGRLAVEALGCDAESYGKGGVAGTSGEQEHANACLTSAFGDVFRDALGGGRAWISSATKVGGPGTPLDVPLAYKDELWVRSHYDAFEVRVPDAPLPDEILVVAVVANRGRVNARLGGMTKDAARAKLADQG